MFGAQFTIENDLKITMRPFRDSDVLGLAQGFSSYKVRHYLRSISGVSEEFERDWIQKIEKSTNEIVWAIVPGQEENAKGCISINSIDDSARSGTVGIAIFDPAWWGQGVATTTHTALLYYASTVWNLWTLSATVYEPNLPSARALLKNGYVEVGRLHQSEFRDGHLADVRIFQWINPYHAEMIFHPNPIPELFTEAVQLSHQRLQEIAKIIPDLLPLERKI
ncbi:GNAT family N-acetyltransferase [Candidatus Dojkabacteria bacterium]|nr:GNAT family N-acetyltransferase [Candidatus Dojkabacteria bacterium]